MKKTALYTHRKENRGCLRLPANRFNSTEINVVTVRVGAVLLFNMHAVGNGMFDAVCLTTRAQRGRCNQDVGLSASMR